MGKIRCHKQPVCYLNAFSDNGLSSYDLKTGRKDTTTAAKVARETDFYVITDKHGKRHTEVEELLGEFETPYTPIIEKVDKGQNLTSTEKGQLIGFVAMLILRTDTMRAASVETWKLGTSTALKLHAENQSKKFQDFVKHVRSRYPKLKEENIKKIIENFDPSTPLFNKNHKTYIFLTQILLGYKEVFKTLSARKWRYYREGGKNPFITCDHPYFVFSETSQLRGIGHPECDLYIPLSMRTCLILSDDLTKKFLSPPKIRQKIVNASRRFIYYSNAVDIKQNLLNRTPTMRHMISSKRKGKKYILSYTVK